MKYLFPHRVLLLVACLSFISFQSFGQSNQENLLPKITPESPNMASLGRYGDYKVNLFTGMPTISIPLFEVKSGGLSVPITLSYHASGIRVTDQASWVGLGWTLNTGGAITRAIKGNADESATGYLSTYNSEVVGCTGSEHNYLKNISSGSTDAEPDVFSYNMPGKSGKFLVQPNNEFIKIPHSPVDIQRESNLQSFDFTDENGVMYKFGKDKNGYSKREYDTEATTSWMLTEMKAPNTDDYIEFTYRSGGQVQFSDLSSKITVLDGVHRRENDYSTNEVTVNHGGTTTVLYPEKIIFENGEIRFYESGTVRTDIAQDQYALDRIEIWEKINGILRKIKTINFTTSYFTNALGQNAALKLDRIRIQDKNISDEQEYEQEYSFQYHTNSFSWRQNNTNPLFMRDYWGFYNGATINNTNSTLIPQQDISIETNSVTGDISIGAADRSPNPAYLTEGVLKRISYPTGGYTEFSFEPNKYYEPLTSTEETAGGLRIERIESYEGAGSAPVVKTYKYGLGESGHGQRNFFQSLAFYNFTNYSYYKELNDNNEEMCYGTRSRTYVSSSMEHLTSYDGSPVVYPYVTEYQGTIANNNGKIVYEFDNGSPSADNIEAVGHTGKHKRISFHWKRGHLTRKTTFDTQGRTVADLVNSYTSLGVYTTPKVGLMAYEAFVQDGGYTSDDCYNRPGTGTCGYLPVLREFFNLFKYYDVTTGVKKVTHSTEHLYAQNDATNTNKVEKSTAYLYNTKLQLTQSKESTSNGTEEIVTKYRYPQNSEYKNSNNLAIAKLKDQNILTSPIEKYVIRQNSGGSNKRLVSAKLTSFRLNQANGAQVVADKIHLLEIDPALPNDGSIVLSTANSSGFIMDSRYKAYASFSRYDAYGNILELKKENDYPITYLWAYNNTLPIAEIKNTDPEDFAYTSFEDNVIGNWVINDLSKINNSYGKIGNRSYLLDNATIYKDGLIAANTYIVSYWTTNADPIPSVGGTVGKIASSGGWNLYRHKVSGESSIVLLGSGLVEAYVDELRLYPEGAEMTSYVYRPLTGLTFSVDANALPTIYQYDDFGRLNRLVDHEGKVIKEYRYNYK